MGCEMCATGEECRGPLGDDIGRDCYCDCHMYLRMAICESEAA